MGLLKCSVDHLCFKALSSDVFDAKMFQCIRFSIYGLSRLHFTSAWLTPRSSACSCKSRQGSTSEMLFAHCRSLKWVECIHCHRHSVCFPAHLHCIHCLHD